MTKKANIQSAEKWVRDYMSDFLSPEHDELKALVRAIQRDALGAASHVAYTRRNEENDEARIKTAEAIRHSIMDITAQEVDNV